MGIFRAERVTKREDLALEEDLIGGAHGLRQWRRAVVEIKVLCLDGGGGSDRGLI